MTGSGDLRDEARKFARYLISEEPSAAAIERYTSAVSVRLGAHAPDRIVCVARAFPALLGPLDAAAGLVDRDHQLRRRLLLLVAILETSPEHSGKFLPRDYSGREMVMLLVSLCVIIPFRAAVGLPVFLALRIGAQR